MPFVAVCPEQDVPPGGMRRYDLDGRAIAIYHLEAGFCATAAICTHEHADLTLGRLEGGRVICPLHGARFDVASGRALGPPAHRPLKVFPVRLREGTVEVDLG